MTARGAATALLVACSCHAAYAAEWRLGPQLQMTAGFDTNVTFRTADPPAAFSGGIAPELEIGRRTETLDLSLSGRYNITGYTPHSELNKPGAQQLALQGTQLLERGRISGVLGWRRYTIFNTVDDADTDVQVQQPVQVDALSSLANFSYQLTEIDTLDLVGGYANTKYDSADLTSSRSYSTTASLSHAFSEIDTLLVNATYVRRISDNASNTINQIYGLGIGWRHLFSERLWAQGTIGPQYVTSDSELQGVSQTTEALGYNLDARASYLFDELTRITFGASHQTEPGSGISSTVTRNRFQLTVGHEVTPRTTFLVTAGLTQSALAGNVNRDVYSFEPSLTWRLDQDWDLKSSYRFRASETRDSQGTSSARSHALLLSLTWHPLPWIWSE
jgi:hypothetical protein